MQLLGWVCLDEQFTLLRALFTEQGDESYRSVAERLGIPVGSIGPTRARCFGKIRKILLDLGVEPPTPVV